MQPDHQRLAIGEPTSFRRRTPAERAIARLSGLLGRGAPRAALARAYEGALWVATAGRGFRATLPHGEIVRLAPACRGATWNRAEYDALRTATRPGAIVIDAGANVGAYSVLFAQWTGQNGHVFAFEPVSAVARLLRRQLRLNGVEDRVSVVESAVGAGPGRVVLTAPGLVGINRAAAPGEAADDLVDVPAISIDAFCAARRVRPSVIKIDVEGAELEVLRGARETIAGSAALELFVEMHPSLWPRYGICRADLARELAAQGLVAEPLRADDDVWRVEGICARLRRRR